MPGNAVHFDRQRTPCSSFATKEFFLLTARQVFRKIKQKMGCCGPSRTEMQTHRERRREVEGCLKCGKEVPVGSVVYVCGVCSEKVTFCRRCRVTDWRPRGCSLGHPLHAERVNLEVDPSLINAAGSVAAKLAACFKVCHPSALCCSYCCRCPCPAHRDPLAQDICPAPMHRAPDRRDVPLVIVR